MTQPTSTKRRWSWFYLDELAVVDDNTGEAFALGDKGWRPVKSAKVEWDGRPLTEEAARSAFRSSLAKFGNPPPISRRDPNYSPAATLAMARAMSRVAAKYEVPDLASMTEKHEKQALAEIKTYHFPAPKLLQ